MECTYSKTKASCTRFLVVILVIMECTYSTCSVSREATEVVILVIMECTYSEARRRAAEIEL